MEMGLGPGSHCTTRWPLAGLSVHGCEMWAPQKVIPAHVVRTI